MNEKLSNDFHHTEIDNDNVRVEQANEQKNEK